MHGMIESESFTVCNSLSNFDREDLPWVLFIPLRRQLG